MVASVQIINGPIIQANESLSDAVDCSAGKISRITMPAEWDRADLSFEVSTDGNSFNPLYWASGDQYFLRADKGRTIIIDQDDWVPGLWVKFRSGAYGIHVPQTATREFAIALVVAEQETPERAQRPQHPRT